MLGAKGYRRPCICWRVWTDPSTLVLVFQNQRACANDSKFRTNCIDKERACSGPIILNIFKTNSQFFVKIPQITDVAYGRGPIVCGTNPILRTSGGLQFPVPNRTLIVSAFIGGFEIIPEATV
jgi:hypothetical protein